MKAHLTAIVLAAGKGTRMCLDRPKVLTPLCGRPMLLYIVEALRALKPERIFLVVGENKAEIQDALKSHADLEWIMQKEPLGTGHAVQIAAPQWQKSKQLLVVCGDTPLLRAPTLQHMLDCHSQHAIDGASVLTAELENPYGYGRIVREGKNILAIREEVDASKAEKQIREINAGVYLFDVPRLLPALQQLKPSNQQKEIYLTDAIQSMHAAGATVHAHRSKDAQEILGVNTLEELSAARRILQQRILSKLMSEGVDIEDPATTFIDADVQIGQGTRILPCTVIRSGVKIGKNCEVGPFAHLRAQTVLENGAEIGNFTEVKKSHIGARTKAKHLSYLGDAKIGSQVNIGAGTITANYDGKQKHITEIGDGAFIGSGTVIVAPAVVGKQATTGAGAIITKKTKMPDGSVYVGVPAKPIGKKVLD